MPDSAKKWDQVLHYHVPRALATGQSWGLAANSGRAGQPMGARYSSGREDSTHFFSRGCGFIDMAAWDRVDSLSARQSGGRSRRGGTRHPTSSRLQDIGVLSRASCRSQQLHAPGPSGAGNSFASHEGTSGRETSQHTGNVPQILHVRPRRLVLSRWKMCCHRPPLPKRIPRASTAHLAAWTHQAAQPQHPGCAVRACVGAGTLGCPAIRPAPVPREAW